MALLINALPKQGGLSVSRFKRIAHLVARLFELIQDFSAADDILFRELQPLRVQVGLLMLDSVDGRLGPGLPVGKHLGVPVELMDSAECDQDRRKQQDGGKAESQQQ